VYIKISHLISIAPIRLVQSNESNRYQMDHNICTVGAPKLWSLKFLCILVYSVQTMTWCSIMIKGRHLTLLQGDPIWGSCQHHLQHLLQRVHIKHQTLSLSIHWYYSWENNLACGTYCLVFNWSHWLSCHCQIMSFNH
jgi:hypothetical protein